MKTVQAYRFALDLTPTQERAVLAHAGAARVAHNWALARLKAVMDQRAAERTYGVPDDQLTPAVSWSLAGLRKAWNAAKADVAPWWGEVSKEAFNTGLDALARGLKNWTDSRVGTRSGRPVGFPRFKSRRRTTPSVRFTTGAIRVEPDRAGKTTLIATLVGAAHPASGRVRLDGRVVVGGSRQGRSVLRDIGWLPQTFGFPQHMTVEEFVGYAGWLKEVPRARLAARVSETIALVGLEHKTKQALRTLSGGQLRERSRPLRLFLLRAYAKAHGVTGRAIGAYLLVWLGIAVTARFRLSAFGLNVCPGGSKTTSRVISPRGMPPLSSGE